MVDVGPLNPWLPPAIPWPPGYSIWVSTTEILNDATGCFSPLAAEIHRDDLDWLCRSWQAVLEIESKVRQASREAET